MSEQEEREVKEKACRVRMIRKAKKMNQTEFGKIFGIGQRAVAHIETGENKLSERNLEIICKKLNVNEHWLKTGEGAMFNPPPVPEPTPQDFLELLPKWKGLSEQEKHLVRTIIDLPTEARIQVIDWAMKLTTAIDADKEDAVQSELQELERDVAAKQKRIAELKQQGASPYIEELLSGTG